MPRPNYRIGRAVRRFAQTKIKLASPRGFAGRSKSFGARNLILLILTSASLSGTAHCQLLFNSLSQNTSVLRQVNLNGSGNVPLTIGSLPEAEGPTLSNDGRFLAVTSRHVTRPMLSKNVYSFDSATNQVRQVTQFEDTNDPATGANFTHAPLYKAYSPDGSLIAVTDFLQTSTNLQGLSVTPITSIYRVADGFPVGVPTPVAQRDGFHTGGDGLDWSPVADQIVSPFPNGATTALFSRDSQGGNLTQLTFPRNGVSGPLGQAVSWSENDSFPAFSPNGQALAYFRSLDSISLSTGQEFPAQVGLRITSPNGDREILSLNQGTYPSGLTWSPDGTQLAYGVGRQVFSGGAWLNAADPSTSEVHIVNVDGSSPRPFLNAPAYFPEWAPFQPNSNPNLDFNGDGSLNSLDLASSNGLFSVGDLTAGVAAAGRERFDLTGDGVVNQSDLETWLRRAATARGFNSPFAPGDTDLDGLVAFGDFLVLAENFASGREWSQGNFDGSLDGTQFADFLALAENFGANSATAKFVPEPASWWPAVLSFAWLVFFSRGRSRS